MSVPAQTRAELLKLARTLGVEPDELVMLEAAAPEDLRELRGNVSDALFAGDHVRFERIVKLADKVPAALAATLAQRAMGARLAARAAGLIRPEQAADMTRRLPPEFLADVAVSADVRKIGHLLGHVPSERIGAITAELQRREEWVTMGAFVGFLHAGPLAAALEELHGAALLRTGFVMEDRNRIDDVVSRLSDDRLDELVVAAADEGLWLEALDLATYTSPAQLKRLAAALRRLDDDRLDTLKLALEGDPEVMAVARPMIRAVPVALRRKLGQAA